MSEPIKKYITTDDILRLDYILQQTEIDTPNNFTFNKYENIYEDLTDTNLNENNINVLQTNNLIFEPDKGEGIYEFELNNQIFEIHVIDTPENAINQFKLDEKPSETLQDSIGELYGLIPQEYSIVSDNYRGGSALKGDGNNAINLGSQPELDNLLFNNSWTIACTVQFTDSSSSDWIFGTSDDDSFYFGMNTENKGNIHLEIQVIPDDSSSGRKIPIQSSGGVVSENTKHRIVFRKEGSKFDGYVDSSHVDSGTAKPDFSNITNWTLFDRENSDYYNGILDNFIIYNLSLTQNEIDDDYNRQPWS